MILISLLFLSLVCQDRCAPACLIFLRQFRTASHSVRGRL